MCGICGAIAADKTENTSGYAEGLTRRMLSALRHRGPDDEGILSAPPVSMGMRRLSIIDLPGGNQPIWNESNTLALVYNGEIYNFRELRRTLESLGHRFHTNSDSEVVVHAYETWGTDCPRYFQGMFAFAILDLPHGPQGPPRQIFLARDRMGIKPLYYATADGTFLFASEVRALLASGIITPRISTAALECYLLFGSVGEPMTLVEGIQSLPPGHSLLLTVAQPAPSPQPYWDIGSVVSGKKSEPSNQAPPAKDLRALLENAVRGHLIADVPLGIFLSSGLDSTALAALASREHQGIHTLSVVFTEQDYSEAEIARRSAQRYRTEHSELLLTGKDMLARLDEAVAAFDQPSMDGVNSYFVSWAARQVGLKVALSGLGSDEIFGGYSTFRSTPQVSRLAALGRLAPSRFRSSTSRAMEVIAARRGSPDSARKLAAAWRNPQSLPHGYFFTRALFTSEAAPLQSLSTEESDPPPAWRSWLAKTALESDQLDPFTAVSWLELRSYMVSTLLRDTDAMSMSHSLEVRVPFLDHPLVEYVLRLPASAKQHGRFSKPLLVAALSDLLPEEVIAQRKRTFTFPWENWLRGPLKARVNDSFLNLSPVLLRSLDEHKVRNVWQDFLSGRTSWSRPWSLYVLNEWARSHLEVEYSRPAAEATAAAAPS
ncbi:MAG: asparagine synthase (glutamine-hydrolyzing) [Candidatus Acidiferrales bacterium]